MIHIFGSPDLARSKYTRYDKTQIEKDDEVGIFAIGLTYEELTMSYLIAYRITPHDKQSDYMVLKSWFGGNGRVNHEDFNAILARTIARATSMTEKDWIKDDDCPF
jgi:hypothetical protein